MAHPALLLLAAAAIGAVGQAAQTVGAVDPGAAPEQLRIAAAGPTAMRVSWKTANATAESTCTFGRTPSALNATASGSQRSYLPSYGFYHVVELSPLAPATRYFYACGGAPVNNFTTPFADPGAEVSMAIFGDWGWLDSTQRPGVLAPIAGLDANWTATWSRQLLDTLQLLDAIDGTWVLGDVSYADDASFYLGKLLSFHYEDVLDGWGNWLSNLSSTKPLYASCGNHESECHSGFCLLNLESHGLKLNNFSAFNARFGHMPGSAFGTPGAVPPMWYSWRMGGVAFISLNTETDFPGAPEEDTGDSGLPFLPAGHFAPPGAYLAWLEGELAAAAADPTINFIVAGGHRVSQDFENSTHVNELFGRYGVDMYLAGHGHSYFRDNLTAWGDGTQHIMVGGAGCDSMAIPADQMGAPLPADWRDAEGRTACEAWCQRPYTRASMKDREPCHYCAAGPNRDVPPVYSTDRVSIGLLRANATTLTWQLLRAPDGLVLDEVALPARRR